LTKATTYTAFVLLLLASAGCGRKMTTTKARLVEPKQVENRSAAGDVSIESEEYFDNGLSLFRAGESKTAAEFFVRAIKADSSNWKAHYYLGLAYRKDGDLRAAVTSLHDALTYATTRHRDRSMIYLALGELFEEQEDFSRAQLSYRTALNLYPGSDRARAGLKRVEQLTQQSQK